MDVRGRRRSSRVVLAAGLVVMFSSALAPGPAAKTRAKAPRSHVDTPYLRSDVDLPVEIVERAKANHRLYLVARTSVDAFCAFVADSVSLMDPLMTAFNKADLPQPPVDPDDGVYGAMTSGASAYNVEGGLREGLEWKNLLEAAPVTGRAVVKAVQALEGDESWGAWIHPVTDLGGCIEPQKAVPALQLLVTAWRDAPPCLRGAFQPFVVDELTQLATYGCFCAPESEKKIVATDMATNARLVEGLPEIGPPIARKLRAAISRPGVQFRYPGPH